MPSSADIPELISHMWEFGLSQEVGLVYVCLLINGPASVEGIMNEVGVSLEKAKGAIKELIRLRLASSGRRNNKIFYYATDPSIAWLAIVADLVWSNKVDIGSIRNLSKTNDLNVERSRQICGKIIYHALNLYTPHLAVVQHREHDTETSNELAQMICECIYQAQTRILAVSKTPRQSQVSSFWAVLTDRLSNGVVYHRVVDIDEIIDHGLNIVERDFEAYKIDIKVLERSKILHKFYLIDNKYLGIYHQSNRAPMSSMQGVGRVTTQKQIIERYKERFWNYHSKAIPAQFVISHMREAGKQLIQYARSILLPIELEWLEDRIKYGKFSRFHVQENWHSKKLLKLEQKAILAKLVTRNFDGDVVPVYPIKMENLRQMYISADNEANVVHEI